MATAVKEALGAVGSVIGKALYVAFAGLSVPLAIVAAFWAVPLGDVPYRQDVVARWGEPIGQLTLLIIAAFWIHHWWVMRRQ
ncbi:hypothetical protein [Amorphus sp. 3PC139-8]|uniref:hypothetical protein n=1 Tax=Amorphus sp. 3PC139-8 TaxID=2735676 RepID=UPI00345D1F66